MSEYNAATSHWRPDASGRFQLGPVSRNGVIFNTRIDAAWSVFCDSLRIDWRYERGLFFLADRQVFTCQRMHDSHCLTFAEEHDVRLYRFVGYPPPEAPTPGDDKEHGGISDVYWAGGGDIDHLWCVCPKCERVGIQYEGRGERVCGYRCLSERERENTYDHEKIQRAYRAAFDWAPSPFVPPVFGYTPSANGRSIVEDEPVPTTRPTPKPVGVVYFIQAGEGGAIKIGTTSGPAERRMAAMQTGTADTLRLLCTIPGGVDVEYRLHRRFAALRVRGEWFRPETALLQYILNAVRGVR